MRSVQFRRQLVDRALQLGCVRLGLLKPPGEGLDFDLRVLDRRLIRSRGEFVTRDGKRELFMPSPTDASSPSA
jgi:hypothetical protein